MFVGTSLYYLAPSPQFTESNAAPSIVDNAPAKVIQTVPFDVLDAGTHAVGVEARKNYAAYSKEGLEKIWKIAYGTDAPPLPKVDFSKEYVIGVFAGQKSTGGNSATITTVTEAENMRTVAVMLTKPGEDCMVTQSLTNPYQIVAVPFSDATLTHSDTEVITSCE